MVAAEKKQELGVSIVVPLFNEEGSAREATDRILDVMQGMECPSELIIVDDGSTDSSAQQLNGLRKRLKLISHKVNRGYGAALKTGIQKARYPLVAIMDADGELPVEELPKLISGMKGADMVVGARTGAQVYVPLIRRPAKWLLNKLANYLSDTHIPDLNSGFRVFQKNIVQRYFHILPNRFSFTSTITLAMIADGFTVHFESVNCQRRAAGKSKVRPSDAVGFLILIMRTVTYFNPLRTFVPVFLALLTLAVCKLGYDVFWEHNITDTTTLLWLMSLQVLLIGVVADLVVRRDRHE
jgi:glycosyltransferase involved in cell wall biosynthesis